MTPAFALVHTRGHGYNWIVRSYKTKSYKSNTEGEDFKKELSICYPKATIEWSEEKGDFNTYLVKVPSKAMARRLMWDFSRKKSLRTYWDRKSWKFTDDKTGEEIKLYCSFFYFPESERSEEIA